jgi:hypothetical protein
MFGWGKERAELVKLLQLMQETQLMQTKVMSQFMKSYEIKEPPTSRVLTDEMEWRLEQEALEQSQSGGFKPMVAPPTWVAMGTD